MVGFDIDQPGELAVARGIGAVGASYYQNQRQLADYRNAIDGGVLPVMRGIELTGDDLLRRAVIHSLMCYFALSLDEVETAHRIEFERYFRLELEALEQGRERPGH